MIEETARVLECKDKYALVETSRKSACESCSLNKGCGTGAISKIFSSNKSTIRAINRANATAGDNVIIGINESALIKGSLLMYLMPIGFLLVFAVFGDLMAKQLLVQNSEAITILFAIAGLLISLWWIRRKSTNLEHSAHYQAVILRRLGTKESCQIDSH